MALLFHVSEDGSIQRFEPRPSPPESGLADPVVWAIDEERLPNYLLPRDCPRVTFYPCPDSTAEDVMRLMGASSAARVVAIETAWFERACSTPLYVYHLPSGYFDHVDATAGYYVSSAAVTPSQVCCIDNPLIELIRHNVELRVTPSLWPLRDAVIASSLQFSIIRMRNAAPR